MTGGLRLDWAAASDTGQARSNNQDSAVVEEGLFAVADGMGGHAAGEVASSVAVAALRDSRAHGVGLVEAVHAANRAVWERAGQDPSLRGMGTTLCAVTLVEVDGAPQMLVVNVGDSRVYLFRDGDLQQITDDHSLVADLMREGRLTPDEARFHPQRNILTRVLGNDDDVQVDQFPIDPFRGDRFLLCSDGLFNEVGDDEIARVLRSEKDPQVAADQLVRMANEGGGRDNITVVIVDVVDDGDRARQASAALAGAVATASSAPPSPAAEPRTQAMPVVTVDPEPPPTGREPAAAAAPEPRERRRRVTVRSVAFTLALLLVAGAVVGSVWWFGRNTFYVGVDGDRVTIFRGRPGGVLWIEPTVEQRFPNLGLDDLPAARRDDVRAGKEQSTLDDARAYVRRLRTAGEEEQAPTTTSTTTSSSTTTTSIVGFAPGTTPTSAPATTP